MCVLRATARITDPNSNAIHAAVIRSSWPVYFTPAHLSIPPSLLSTTAASLLPPHHIAWLRESRASISVGFSNSKFCPERPAAIPPELSAWFRRSPLEQQAVAAPAPRPDDSAPCLSYPRSLQPAPVDKCWPCGRESGVPLGIHSRNSPVPTKLTVGYPAPAPQGIVRTISEATSV